MIRLSWFNRSVFFLGLLCIVYPKVALAAPIIRSIKIEIQDVFDESKGSLYRSLNSIKVNTKESVVRRELLFHEGEPFDQFRLDESGRFLRALPFFRKVIITPAFDGDYVDILVQVQDQWTLIPQASISLGGGGNSDSVTAGIIERNFLGYGKRTEFNVGKDEGRSLIEAVYDDLRFMDTDQRLFLSFFERSDGWNTAGLWGKPFRSLVQETAWGTSWNFSDTVGRMFALGDERYIFRQQHNEAGVRYTKAYGEPSSSVSRIFAGYEYQRDTFQQADESDFEDVDVDPDTVSHDPNLLPDKRQFSGPVIGIDHIAADFISLSSIDKFEIVQDFNLGKEFSAKIQYAPEILGSDGNTFLSTASARRGIRFGDKEFGRGEIGGSTRITTDGFENSYVRAEEKYFNVLGPKRFFGYYIGQHTLAAAISIEYGEDFDKDRQLLLGAENGLRGYESRTFEGDKRFLLNLEDRIHLIEDVFELMSIGTVIFADVGGTTYGSMGDLFKHDIYSDVGVGLRIGFPRSSGGGVVRIDLAFPLQEDPQGDDRQFQPRLIISTGQIFTGRLATEQYGLEKANVSVGLAR